MRNFMVMGLSALIFTISTTSADARRGGGGGWYEDLEFVADTEYPGLSLCHLVKHQSFLGIPLTTESIGYALAENKCDADSFYHFDAADMKEAQADGVIDRFIPIEPSISSGQQIGNYAWYAVVALVLGAFAFSKIRRFLPSSGGRNRGTAPAQQPKGINPHVSEVILHAMCKVAKADGFADAREIAVIRNVYNQLTGEEIAQHLVTARLDTITGHENHETLNQLGAGLSPEERQLMMQASLMVAVADGEIQREEHGLVMSMAKMLRISGDELRGMLAQIAPRTA